MGQKLRRFFILILLLLLFLAPAQSTSFPHFSLDFFRELFQWESAREVFDLDEKEAIEVFGAWENEVFV